jgi:hypothetical protein
VTLPSLQITQIEALLDAQMCWNRRRRLLRRHERLRRQVEAALASRSVELMKKASAAIARYEALDPLE